MSSIEDSTSGTGQTAPTVPAPEPKPEQKKAATTDYLILSRAAVGGPWTEQKTVSASSAKAAVRGWLAGSTDPDGTYVAVPARSWQPVTVKTETQTKITLT